MHMHFTGQILLNISTSLIICPVKCAALCCKIDLSGRREGCRPLVLKDGVATVPVAARDAYVG